MINKIKYKKQLGPFITDVCEENKVSVSMADDVHPNSFLVIKVDDYYNSLGLGQTPPSVDCLIVLKCVDNAFFVYLIELKSIKSPRGFNVNNIFKKFETTIENFMSKRFKRVFFNERYSIKRLHLYFVSDPYRETDESRRKEGTRMHSILSRKVFKFQGRKYLVKHKLPNPMIENC